MIQIKRTYLPAAPDDGLRVLVERLWPRGMAKADLAFYAWMKEVAPSPELRQWFGHAPERWNEFRRRYTKELRDNPAAYEELLEAARHGTVTLLYSARDEQHNGALVLRDLLLDDLQKQRRKRARSQPRQPESRLQPSRRRLPRQSQSQKQRPKRNPGQQRQLRLEPKQKREPKQKTRRKRHVRSRQERNRTEKPSKGTNRRVTKRR